MSNRIAEIKKENAAPVTAGNGAALYDTFRSVSRLDCKSLLRLNAIALCADSPDIAENPAVGRIIDLADSIEFEVVS